MQGPAPREEDVDRWLHDARQGSQQALGHLLENSQRYLLHIANQQLDPHLAAKVSPSDVVQETFLDVQRDFLQFHGCSEEEWLAWLRRLLLNNLNTATRSFRNTVKRQVHRELPAHDAARLLSAVPNSDDSPGAMVCASEQTETLRHALQQLPEHYRQVIDWRNYERLSFAVIGERLGKSAEAARKVWARALEQLQDLLEPGDASG